MNGSPGLNARRQEESETAGESSDASRSGAATPDFTKAVEEGLTAGGRVALPNTSRGITPTEMTQTSITDKAEQRWKNDELETGGSVYADDMRALELAANGLRDALNEALLEVRYPKRLTQINDALVAFHELKKAALQPKEPHE